MKRTTLLIIIALLTGYSSMLIATNAPNEPQTKYEQYADHLPDCIEEDSTDCYWNASARGNGLGRSFVTLSNTDGTNTTFFADGSSRTW